MSSQRSLYVGNMGLPSCPEVVAHRSPDNAAMLLSLSISRNTWLGFLLLIPAAGSREYSPE
jgi:hypothetical protein